MSGSVLRKDCPKNIKTYLYITNGIIDHIFVMGAIMGIEYIKIRCLINFNYKLKKPIEVRIIKTNKGEVIGDIEELELYSFGNNESEVLRELNEDLTELFEDIVSIENSKLGRYPRKWKTILKKYIKKHQ